MPDSAGGKTTRDECPYCGRRLDKRPSKKTKCPHCGQFIVVRKPYLMIEREAEITDWSRRLEGLEVTRAQIDSHEAHLARQFGSEPSVNDLIWRVLNSLLTGNPQTVKAAYIEMAHLARSEHKSPLPYLQEAAKLELAYFKGLGLVNSVRVQTVNDHLVCEQCRILEANPIPLEQAISTLPVPNACRNQDGCRCWYTAVTEW